MQVEDMNQDLDLQLLDADAHQRSPDKTGTFKENTFNFEASDEDDE